jgi:hypothetical protein
MTEYQMVSLAGSEEQMAILLIAMLTPFHPDY